MNTPEHPTNNTTIPNTPEKNYFFDDFCADLDLGIFPTNLNVDLFLAMENYQYQFSTPENQGIIHSEQERPLKKRRVNLNTDSVRRRLF